MPVLIKRYRNRKLYNTLSKRYITLEQIEELIKDQLDVQIIDNFTGEDITATTLSQVIFEKQKSRTGFLPQNLLFSLVQSGGYRLEEIRNNIFDSLNLTYHYDVEIEKRIDALIDRGEINQDEGSLLLKKLVSVSGQKGAVVENIGSRIADFMRDRQIPTKNDLQVLIQKIDELSARMDELNRDNVEGN